MSDRDLRSDFWAGFHESLPANFRTKFGDFSKRLGDEGYVHFDLKLPLGFRAVCVALTRDDQLRAELTSDRPKGVALVRSLSETPHKNVTLGGGKFEARISAGKGGFGRLAYVWSEAQTNNRSLWPAHHLWLILSLQDLIETVEPLLTVSAPHP